MFILSYRSKISLPKPLDPWMCSINYHNSGSQELVLHPHIWWASVYNINTNKQITLNKFCNNWTEDQLIWDISIAQWLLLNNYHLTTDHHPSILALSTLTTGDPDWNVSSLFQVKLETSFLQENISPEL